MYLPCEEKYENMDSLVSVIVPVYNGERLIAASVNSIFNQSYRPLELVIIDDASVDGTSEKLRLLQKESKVAFLRVLKHDRNMGLAATLNHGIRESKGKYILVLHQDCELSRNDWIQKGIALFNDEKVAVVTGYYGIPSNADSALVRKGFGVMRKQFHARPSSSSLEELTFSEGKCDIYRRDLLMKYNLFPTRFRIAGEDLETSFRLRSLGYKIIKNYDLPVTQKFGGKAETLSGNLEKEFVFGKAMGAVFLTFGLFLFKGLDKTSYSRTRSLHRAGQPPYVSALILILFAYLLSSGIWFLYLMAALVVGRYFYYLLKIYSELEPLEHTRFRSLMESLAIALLGIPTDIFYSAGFVYGVFLYLSGRRL